MISHDIFSFSYSNFNFSYIDFVISRSDFPISHSDFSISHIDHWDSIGNFQLNPLLSCLACHTIRRENTLGCLPADSISSKKQTVFRESNSKKPNEEQSMFERTDFWAYTRAKWRIFQALFSSTRIFENWGISLALAYYVFPLWMSGLYSTCTGADVRLRRLKATLQEEKRISSK